MATTRSLLAAACVLPLSLVACGGSSGNDAIVPEGTHYGYVVDKVFVPSTETQARDYGLDLGALKSEKLDGTVDNQLGKALSGLSILGIDAQGTVTTAVDEGSVLLLVDFQAKDFANTAAAGLGVKLGTMPSPAPCTGTGPGRTCRQHLAGTGSFKIDSASPPNALLAGKVVGGVFSGGPGDVSLQLALGSAAPITLSLLQARAKATAITDAGMDVVIGGALSENDLNTQLLPTVVTLVNGLIATNCTALTSPPNCGCNASGADILKQFDSKDGSAANCAISIAEINSNALIKSFLAPDVCSKESCSAPDAVSLGIKLHLVKATFPQ